jgi:hypothetical protein
MFEIFVYIISASMAVILVTMAVLLVHEAYEKIFNK